MDLSVFKNKKVILTGHTGFKGAWMAIWLDMLGAKVVGIALDPEKSGHSKGVFTLSNIGERIKDYRQDIRDLKAVQDIFEEEQPEIVFHLAAQALVLTGYQNPVETFAINTQGTVNILEAIRHTPSVKAAVMITTDKCYENKEWVYGYRENDAMGGFDPYSASKGAAELVISSYRRSYFSKDSKTAVASARAGNVIGGGDWSSYRLVPDIIRAVENNETLEIRSPAAVRPWQHVIEPLGGYLLLAANLLRDPEKYAEAWNFGPLPANILPVRDLADAFLGYFEQGKWLDVSDPTRPHEAGLLMLEISKAIHRLNWRPVLNFDETIEFTASWYATYQERDILKLCQEQITKYLELWKSRNGN